jgi:putative membrane-bound dehydrogenase-like protein
MDLRRAMTTLAALLAAIPGTGVVSAQLPPEDEVEALRADGVEVTLFASEPMITNPSAIDVDSAGRVWVAEIQWYRAAAKSPPADKIKVLEDTNRDGRADKVTTFAEGLFCPMSVCVAGDKVYVATSPDLWVYEDKDGNLVADGPPKRVLTGFGGYNHDHGAHSLVLGPDHKWWMAHGDTGFDVTGIDGSHVAYRWGGMLRGELDGSRLELVAHNFRNPYEMGVSSFGEAYVSDNDNDGNFSVRICWILEGGNYGWYGGPPFAKEDLDLLAPPGTPYREHWHFRGHVPGNVPASLVTGFGSPCGMCYYEGNLFGPSFENAALHCDAGPREVRRYRFEPNGYGPKATTETFLSSDGDPYFRPDDVCAAPDGTLFISDWYDGGVGGHAYNNPEQGRIFLVRPEGSEGLAPLGDPGPYTETAAAIEALASPNLARQFLARERILAGGAESIPSLGKLLDGKDRVLRARALWLLDRIGPEGRLFVRKELRSAAAEFRALAVRILRRHGDAYEEEILALARDPSPDVAREVLLALPALSGERAETVLTEAVGRFDGSDRYYLETLYVAARGREKSLYRALAAQGKLSAERVALLKLLDAEATADYLKRTLAQDGLTDSSRNRILEALDGIPSVEVGKTVMEVLSNPQAGVGTKRLALGLLARNLQGPWKSLREEPSLTAGLRSALAEPDLKMAVLSLSIEGQLTGLGAEAAGEARDTKNPVLVRVKALEAAMRQSDDGGIPLAEGLISDAHPEMRGAALDALAQAGAWKKLRELLTAAGTERGLRSEAAERLVSRTDGALVLLKMMEEGALDAELSAAVVARATSHPDINVQLLFERFVPEGARPVRLGDAIKVEEILALDGDSSRGARIFFQSSAAQCKNCHRLRNRGTALGPDLSQIGRKYAREALLDTILNPSRAMAPEFIPYVLETSSGQVHAGFLVSRTETEVVIKDSQARLVRVATKDVVELSQQKKSLMPELVLRDVSAQDAADLLAFLSGLSSTQVQVERMRILGPFVSGAGGGLEVDFGPEGSLDQSTAEGRYPSGDGRQVEWQTISTVDAGGYLAFDQAAWCREHKLPTENVTAYYQVTVTSGTEQEATLHVGSDDGNRVWVNGERVGQFNGRRAIGFSQDQYKARLKAGVNQIVLKVENTGGPGGVALALEARNPVELSP